MRWSVVPHSIEIGNSSHKTANGCGSVGVSTVGCGPAGPGSIPGHGPSIGKYIP